MLTFDLICPNFKIFRNDFKDCFNYIKEDSKEEFNGGKVADYIPTLARGNPAWFASSFCSTDG